MLQFLRAISIAWLIRRFDTNLIKIHITPPPFPPRFLFVNTNLPGVFFFFGNVIIVFPKFHYQSPF